MELDELFPPPILSGDRTELYRQLREESPILPVNDHGTRAWLVMRYSDVERILRMRRATVNPPHGVTPPWLGDGAAALLYRNQLLFISSGDHERLRRLLARAFSAHALERLRLQIRADIGQRLDALAARDEIDIVSDVGDWIPSTATCGLLGIPRSDWPELITQMNAALSLYSAVEIPPDVVARCEAACEFFISYFTRLIEYRRITPGEDLVSDLMASSMSTGDLDRDEILGLMLAIFGGGYETSMTTTANGTLALLQHPEQWHLLASDPTLAPAALEEIIRWHPPVHITPRYLGTPFETDRGVIAPGELVLLAIASANRDDAAFADPDRFDIRRSDNRHISFGVGSHFCLGANLARLSLCEVISLLPVRFPDMTLVDDERPRRPDITLPSLQRLRVRLH